MTDKGSSGVQDEHQFTWIRVHLPSEIHRKIKEFAKGKGMNIPHVVTEALGDYVDTEELLREIMKLVTPHLEEVSVERIAQGTFLIQWRQESVKKEVIIRGSRRYSLEP